MDWDRVAIKIKRLRESLGESQAEFGDRFGVEQGTISRWEKGDPVQRRYHQAMAKLANMSVAEFFFTKEDPKLIPIVGTITEGESFEPTDHPPGVGVDHILLDLGNSEQIALRVAGDSMRPVYRPGDVVIGAKVEGRELSTVIGKDCIVRARDGMGYLKTVHKGTRPNRFRLRSYNPAYPDIEDIELEWAAPVHWVGRAR